MMGDRAVARLAGFGIDTSGLQRLAGVPTSSFIMLTRGYITTVDIFAGSAADLPGVDAVLP
jgi:hypothetical protein